MAIDSAEMVQLVRLAALGYDLRVDTATLAILRFGVLPQNLNMAQCAVLILELERERQMR